jgi:hypothetical protein
MIVVISKLLQVVIDRDHFSEHDAAYRVWSFRIAMRCSLAVLLAAVPLSAADSVQSTRTPVLVELFTSEGCSSCPPADALLIKLTELQPIPGVMVIALEEHVDYWDRQGWRDPFSSAEFTERQRRYGEWLHIDSPYTPEMLVDGQSEFMGSDSRKALSELARAGRIAKVPVRLSMPEKSAGQVSLRVAIDAGLSGDVLLAITESGLATDVARGENAGHNLKHSAVVRKLIPIGKLKAGREFTAEPVVKFAREWKPENLGAVVFVQDRTSGKVLGASELGFEK